MEISRELAHSELIRFEQVQGVTYTPDTASTFVDYLAAGRLAVSGDGKAIVVRPYGQAHEVTLYEPTMGTLVSARQPGVDFLSTMVSEMTKGAVTSQQLANLHARNIGLFNVAVSVFITV